jgi:hypothetical protein
MVNSGISEFGETKGTNGFCSAIKISFRVKY